MLILTEKRNLICVVCPVGCNIEVSMSCGKVTSISGNQCKRGSKYVEEECINPVRTLTSTVRIAGGEIPMLPVKSDRPLPKEKIMECMNEINRYTVSAPVEVGDAVIKGILGMDANIVATLKVKSAN